MAERIREEKSLNPDFDVAVKRHQLLDAIQKASVTGIRQKNAKNRQRYPGRANSKRGSPKLLRPGKQNSLPSW